MSFILDALKKLDEKRRTESVPDLTTVHIEYNEQKKHPLQTYLLVGILFLNALLLAVCLRPQQEETNSFTVKESIENPVPAALKTDEAAVKNAVPPGQEVVEAVHALDIAVTENGEAPAIETASLPLNPSPEEIRDLKRKIASEQFLVKTSPSFESALEEESSPAPERTVLDMSQLPLSIKQGLPDLTITGHIYSNDPMSRLVNINGSVIREGETVATGLRVNEITMSGVVFDYGGLLFSVSAF